MGCLVTFFLFSFFFSRADAQKSRWGCYGRFLAAAIATVVVRRHGDKAGLVDFSLPNVVCGFLFAPHSCQQPNGTRRNTAWVTVGFRYIILGIIIPSGLYFCAVTFNLDWLMPVWPYDCPITILQQPNALCKQILACSCRNFSVCPSFLACFPSLHELTSCPTTSACHRRTALFGFSLSPTLTCALCVVCCVCGQSKFFWVCGGILMETYG